MNPLNQSKNATILPVLIALTLVCPALSPQAWAVCQEGCDFPYNTFLGDDALINDIGFGLNTAIGYQALRHNTTGEQNTAVGVDALANNTSGFSNVAVGTFSLSLNTTGDLNIAIGGMEWNETGSYNTAVGRGSLNFNTTGSNNTAIGYEAGFGGPSNGTGGNNTVTGYQALHSYTTGSFNTASGYSALYTNTTGGFNVAYGGLALFSNTTGNSNTATGYDALYSNQDGMNNTATGVETLVRNTTGSSNTALGYFALNYNTTGSNNIAVGVSAGANLTTGKNNIYIGNGGGTAGESAKIRIGTTGTQKATFIAGISGVTVPSGVGVIVGTDGKLGTVVSSARFKDGIKPMDKASEAIHFLRPVTFRYNEELDPDGISQFGLLAEEVEKVHPDLVVRDEQGTPYSVRYEAVNAMLLNEFLKEHRKNEKQEATIARQQKQIEALTAGVQKVSAQLAAASPSDGGLEISTPALQTVANNQ